MREQITVRAFGPLRDVDVIFEKVTVFIGDQGTGKSCLAKLFSMFKWLEKQLAAQYAKARFYETYDRFRTKLCAYHRIDSYISESTYIKYVGNSYTFCYKDGHFSVKANSKQHRPLSKIMYVPAERMIVSIAENKPRLLKELPDSCETFFNEFVNAKAKNKAGYILPFTHLRFEYDTLNDTSWVMGAGFRTRLVNASSGIQSALPLCLVTDYLANLVKNRESLKLSKDDRTRITKQVQSIINNDSLSESLKEILLKQLSDSISYGSFINIAEEPELNLFPRSQMDVLQSLVSANNMSNDNMLVLTTHSPYTLAILNLFILAAKVDGKVDDHIIKEKTEQIIPKQCWIKPDDISAICLTEDGTVNQISILSDRTKLISKNLLDGASDDIMKTFNKLYRLYVSAK